VEPIEVGPFLRENSDKDFVKRILYKDKYPVIQRDDGSVSTHKMAAEKTPDGRWLVFPTIVNTPEGLVEFPVGEGEFPEEAWRYALQNQEYIEFKDGDEAQWFAREGYKSLWDDESQTKNPHE
jgi:hypothetical protein